MCERLLVPEAVSALDLISSKEGSGTGLNDTERLRAHATLQRFEDLLPLLDQAGYEVCMVLGLCWSWKVRKVDNLLKFDVERFFYSEVQKIIYEDFWEPLHKILKSISTGEMTRVQELMQAFNDQETCANIIIFLRLLTSAYLKHHQDDFVPFLLSFEEDYERFPNGLTL